MLMVIKFIWADSSWLPLWRRHHPSKVSHFIRVGSIQQSMSANFGSFISLIPISLFPISF